jgi:hypothetical protein
MIGQSFKGARMSDREQPRDLTPPTAGRWKVVGLELAHRCTFCNRPASATVGCPDDGAPVLWQVGVCDDCLTDCVMRRFSEVKHQRVLQLADDMRSAANEIRATRERAGQARYERGFPKKPDPEIEAEAARQLVAEEERIARKYDMCPGWTYDEDQKETERLRQERRKRR